MEIETLCLHQLFEKQVDRTPKAPAVVDGERALTYEELDHITNRLAGYLQHKGVRFDESVGIFMEPSVDYLIAYIAILKAGGAYIPLNLAYPDVLLKNICADAGPKAILTKQPYRNRISPGLAPDILSIDVDETWEAIPYDRDAVLSESLDHLAFIAYTSGTTGEPKGVLVPHRAVVHSYRNRYRRSDYKPGDRVACNIFFVWEVMRPLLKGATCYIIPDEIAFDPRLLSEYLTVHQINEVLFTPSLLNTLINAADAEELRAKWSSLNVIWLNGEVVTVNLKNKILGILPEHTRLLNTYSICECHDVADVDLREVEDLPSGICSVGSALPGVELRLLDALMDPVPSGTEGELYVGGPCLARGYLNKPDLTALRFVPIDGKRYYNTGDLGIVHSDGNLEVIGRCDFMVKIRGYSIHLGAVETALLDRAGVKSCAVVVDGEEGEDKRLVAYVVRDKAANWKIDERSGTSVDLRHRLKPHLPHYMIPGAYVEIERIPIHPVTGKLNRKLLPAPPAKSGFDYEDIAIPEDASRQEQETVMCLLWKRLLDLDASTIRTDTNFFDYGGHSLLAAELTVAIEQIFGVKLMVKDIYEYPTVHTVVHYMNRGRWHDLPPRMSIREDAYLDLSILPADSRKPLCLQTARSFFITGTTGFLGAFLLDELLRSTDEQVKAFCLVRTKNGESKTALNRIFDNLRYYRLYDADMKERIIAVPGDLTRKHLGLPRERFHELAGKIDVIFHCASLVNYVYSYAVIKPTAVNGTHEILRLAATSNTKPIHYISTNGIFPRGDRTTYMENDDIDLFADKLETGYEQAKWVAEKLVWEAVSRKMPVCLYRPGNIGHHSLTGAANPNDFQTMILDACHRIRCAPEDDRWSFEITPVDFFVKAIVAFAKTPSHYGQVHNVIQKNPLAGRVVFDLMMEMEWITATVPLKEWKKRLGRKATDERDRTLGILSQSMEDFESHLMSRARCDGRGFDLALSKCNLQRPAIGADYFLKLFTTKNPPRPSNPGR